MPIDAYFRGLFEMVAKPISEFKQGELTGAAPVGVVDEDDPKVRWQLPTQMHTLVKGGFCHGASLDWLRKVIQRDNPARYAITHRKWSRVSRMVNTHVENKTLRAGASGFVDARAQAAVAAATSARDAAIARAKTLLIEWAEGNGCTFEESAKGMTIRNAPTPEIRAMIGSKFDEFDEMVRKAQNQLKQSVAVADATVARWNAATPGESMEISWSDIARQLGTDAGKRRTFSGITPAAGSSRSTYADLKSFVTDAVSAPAFIPGRGMLISLSFVPEPGHSIAAHKESDESYILFDPNLGIYRCKGLARFVTALVVLVEECYLTSEPGKAVTALGSGHAWHVFLPDRRLDPGRRQRQLGKPRRRTDRLRRRGNRTRVVRRDDPDRRRGGPRSSAGPPGRLQGGQGVGDAEAVDRRPQRSGSRGRAVADHRCRRDASVRQVQARHDHAAVRSAPPREAQRRARSVTMLSVPGASFSLRCFQSQTPISVRARGWIRG